MTYTYDDNGSTLSRTLTDTGATQRYVWDLRGRMVGFDANGDNDTADVGDFTYAYDSQGVRVKMVEKVADGADVGTDADDQPTYFLQDLSNPTGYSQVLEEWGETPQTRDASDKPTRSFAIGGDVIAQADGVTAADGSTVRHLLYDAGGSTRALLDATGQPVTGQVYAYDAFGNRIDPATPITVATPLLYRGEYFDAKLGQYQLRARYYNPALGRFSSGDPRMAGVGDFRNANLYSYTSADPINYVDPNGEMTLSELAVNFAISSVIAYVVSPVIKPIVTSLANAIAGALLPPSMDNWLNEMGSRDPELMAGGDFMGGIGYSSGSITFGGSLEVLAGPEFIAGYYALGGAVSAGGSGGWLRGSIGPKAGMVFGAESKEDYLGAFRTISVPFGSLPTKLRDKIGQRTTQFTALAQRYLTAGLGLHPAGGRWLPGFEDMFKEVQSLSKDLSWASSKLANLAKSSSLSVFWDPADGDPFGFSLGRSWGNAGSVSVSFSDYYGIGFGPQPWNTPPTLGGLI